MAIWNVALTDTEIAILGRGFSPLCLTHRLSSLVLYQDLIRPLDHPGVGPAMAAEGGTTTVPHPRIVYPWSVSASRIRKQFLKFYRAAAAAAHADRVVHGETAVTGAELGATYPIGEVAN